MGSGCCRKDPSGEVVLPGRPGVTGTIFIAFYCLPYISIGVWSTVSYELCDPGHLSGLPSLSLRLLAHKLCDC